MTNRRSIAILVFAPLLLAMAAGQLADLGGFRGILEDYRALGGAEGAAAVVIPAVEVLAGAALLARRRLPRPAVGAAAAGGVLVAVFWSALTMQAFARGLALDNCGCFGVYLGQSLRWWVLLEDAEFLLLAGLSVRAIGRRPRLHWRFAAARP
ncbi:MAG: MauE/DoxX family redox-associated membrane protein [Gaiellaceae bacterium]